MVVSRLSGPTPTQVPATPSRPVFETVIIGVHAGGLGDHLAYSALPRLYKSAGAAKVLISRRTNNGDALARNAETVDYVWGLNPYVDGLTDEPANVGETAWPPVAFFEAAKRAASPIEAIADVHGLSALATGPQRILPPRPDLFYHPKDRLDFAGKVVCDPHSISQPFTARAFNAFARFVADWHAIDADEIVVLCNRHSGRTSLEVLPNNARYDVETIFEYTDIIASAPTFLVTESGGQSVAAAVRERGTFVLTTSRAFNQRHFIWPSNRYCVTGEMTPGPAEWPTRPTPST